MARYFFDTEFMEDGRTIELLSIGMVCEDGREFYAESSDADRSHANEWVQANVIPHLWSRQPDKAPFNRWSRDGGTGGLLRQDQIGRELRRFVDFGDGKPEFWAYYGDYDWVVLCQLYGTMMDLPDGWPMFAMDVKQLAVSLGDPDLPEQTSTEHHALADARWTRDAWQFLAALPEVKGEVMDDVLSESDRLELARLRKFVRRLGYLKPHMAGGEQAMLEALTDDRYKHTLEGLDRWTND